MSFFQVKIYSGLWARRRRRLILMKEIVTNLCRLFFEEANFLLQAELQVDEFNYQGSDF